MAVKTSKANKKIAYDKKLCQLLDEYNQILVAAADNGLRGTAGGDGESAAQEKDASGEIPCVCERRDKELQTRSHFRSS
ncbi:hypothetical protein LguiA_013191 [Lonicera macranthoides]